MKKTNLDKKVILLSTILFLVSGCGNENSLSHGEGKGKIDIVSYLPNTNMIKKFYYADHGSTLYSGNGLQDITVTDNTIKIIQTARSGGRFYTGDVVQELTTTFDDLYIKFYDMSKKLYRHIDLGEIQSEFKSKKTTDYFDTEYSDDGLILGTEDNEYSNICWYSNITDEVKNTSGETVKKGEFLVVKCEEIDKTTYHIDKAYRKDIPLNNLYKKKKKTSYKYYEKNIGLIAKSTRGIRTKKPCSGNNCKYIDFCIIYNYFAKVQ